MCFCLISKEYEDRGSRKETQLSCRDYCAANIWEEKFRILGKKGQGSDSNTVFPEDLFTSLRTSSFKESSIGCGSPTSGIWIIGLAEARA